MQICVRNTMGYDVRMIGRAALTGKPHAQLRSLKVQLYSGLFRASRIVQVSKTVLEIIDLSFSSLLRMLP